MAIIDLDMLHENTHCVVDHIKEDSFVYRPRLFAVFGLYVQLLYVYVIHIQDVVNYFLFKVKLRLLE